MVEVRKYNVTGSNNEYLGFRKGEIEARTIQGEDAENIRVYRYCLERTPYTVYLASNNEDGWNAGAAVEFYVFYDKKNYWLTAVPATFMSAVSVTYFLLGNECLGQFLNTKTADGATIYNTALAYPVGIIAAIVFLGIFLYTIKKRHTQPHYETLHK